MATPDIIVLWNFSILTQPDAIPWLVSLPLLLAGLVLIVLQLRQHKLLSAKQEQLTRIKRHSIEYELVMKTMRLCVWRIDIPTQVITYESDYRDYSDSFLPQSGASLQTLYDQLEEVYVRTFRKGLEDLMADRCDTFHEQYQMKIAHSDNAYWAESYATVDKRDLTGKPLTIVGTSMRIDKQKEIEKALMEAVYHAEESDRLKSAFLANISHEVRTPLNAIVGFSEVLPMAQSDEERDRLTKLIKQNNAYLLRLFDDMVRMSKLEARSGETIKKTLFPLKPLLQEVANKYQTESEDTGVPIIIDPASENIQVSTDRDRLCEILNQFLNNAVKFTPHGSITLGHTRDGLHIRIWVKDTGIGIPPEKCNEHIFDRFVKIDEFVAGTGLGLSICRSLAKQMGGQVGVSSEVGKGSCFWVDLPVE